MSIVFYLLGALGIGYLFGFSFAKAKIGEKLGCKIKELQETINQKNLDQMNIKKSYREENREKIHLKTVVDKQIEALERKDSEFSNLTKKSKKLKTTLLEKDEVVKELETLVLEIQEDYCELETKANEKDSKLIKAEKAYRQNIEKLTQKANDLYMVKGTDELKNAKDVFNNLREKAIKKD